MSAPVYIGVYILFFGYAQKPVTYYFYWSGRGDLNARPPAPKAGALPGCATPRLSTYLILNHFPARCKGLLSPPWQNRDKTPGWAETVAKYKSQQYQ